MNHANLYAMLQDLYPNNQGSQRPLLLTVGWDLDAPVITLLAAIDFDLAYANSVANALRHLRENTQVDAVLLHAAANFDVYSAVAALRLYTAAPIVILFSAEQSINPSQAVDAGADDWLLDSIHPTEFTARVYARIRRHRFNQRTAKNLQYTGRVVRPQSTKQPRPLT